MSRRYPHTPGPWVYRCGSVYAPDGRPLMHMDREPGNGVKPPERDSNARLAALAPDMLNALDDLIFDCDALGFSDPDANVRGVYLVNLISDYLPALRALTAKARDAS